MMRVLFFFISWSFYPLGHLSAGAFVRQGFYPLGLLSVGLFSGGLSSCGAFVHGVFVLHSWNILAIIVNISSYLSISHTAKFFNGSERRYIPQCFLTAEQIGNLLLTQASRQTFSKNLVFLLMKTISKHTQMIVV